jgi:hypothetical protein
MVMDSILSRDITIFKPIQPPSPDAVPQREKKPVPESDHLLY